MQIVELNRKVLLLSKCAAQRQNMMINCVFLFRVQKNWLSLVVQAPWIQSSSVDRGLVLCWVAFSTLCIESLLWAGNWPTRVQSCWTGYFQWCTCTLDSIVSLQSLQR